MYTLYKRSSIYLIATENTHLYIYIWIPSGSYFTLDFYEYSSNVLFFPGFYVTTAEHSNIHHKRTVINGMKISQLDINIIGHQWPIVIVSNRVIQKPSIYKNYAMIELTWNIFCQIYLDIIRYTFNKASLIGVIERISYLPSGIIVLPEPMITMLSAKCRTLLLAAKIR